MKIFRKLVYIFVLLIILTVLIGIKVHFQKQKVETGDLIETSWEWVNNQEKFYQGTSQEINLLLSELQQRFPNQDERMKALVTLREDTPYRLGCLGEESGRDQDPVFRIDVTDCTAFVLTTVALLHSHDLQEARDMMRFLNYQPDQKISFGNRLHFTTDRNSVSPYFYDATEEMAGSDKIMQKQIILNKIQENGDRLININWQKETIIKYVPNKYITVDFFSQLPQVIGVAFVGNSDENIGLDVRHEGILIDGENLYHASSVKQKVVGENFFDYYFDANKLPRFNGILFFGVE